VNVVPVLGDILFTFTSDIAPYFNL